MTTGPSISTRSLPGSSPAIGNAVGASPLMLDQRYFPRDASPDSGAYEFNPNDVLPLFDDGFES